MRRPALLALASLALAVPSGAGDLTVGAGASVDLGSGSLDTGEGDLAVAGTLSAGSQGLDARDVDIQATGILNGDSAQINVCGDWSNAGTFNAGTGSVAFVDGCGTTSSTITGASSFHDLSFTTTSGKQVNLAAGVTQTVSGTFGLDGSSGNLLVLRSTSDGSEAFLDLDNAASGDYVDVKDVHATDQAVTLGPGSVDSGNASGFEFGILLVPALGALGLAALAATFYLTGRRSIRSRA